MKLYVGNLSYDASEADIRDLFGEYGEVDSVAVITDKFTGRPKGFAFVEMSSSEGAQAAIDALNGTEFKGRQLNVDEARPPKRDGGGGGGRRGGSGGGGGGGRRGGGDRW